MSGIGGQPSLSLSALETSLRAWVVLAEVDLDVGRYQKGGWVERGGSLTTGFQTDFLTVR